jgi:hypothetical protein
MHFSAADFGDFYQDEEAQSFCRSCPTRSRRYIGDGLGVNKNACQCLEGSKASCNPFDWPKLLRSVSLALL